MSRKARRVSHFPDPKLEAQVDELVRAQNADVEASETAESELRAADAQLQAALSAHAAAIANVHGVDDSGVESKAGAQAKADAAEARAEAYVDQHAAATTGVHGVGASEVESKTGAQAKVDAHASAISGIHGVGTAYVAKTTRADQWPDWSNIQGKPSQYPPTPHASAHASGGSDPITPASIGAETPSGAQAKANEARAAAEATAQAALSAHKSASPLDHPDGSVTDAKLGNRAVDQASAPTGNTGTLSQLLSWLANRIKAITGKANWYDAPDTTLAAAAAHIAAAAPHSSHETPAGAQAKVDNHSAATTGVHGVDSYRIAKTSRSDQWPDWADVQNKPSTFTPAPHKATHASGGSDALTPADIGAVSKSGDTVNGPLSVNGRMNLNTSNGRLVAPVGVDKWAT